MPNLNDWPLGDSLNHTQEISLKKVTATRRDFLKAAGVSTITLTSSSILANLLSGCATTTSKRLNPKIPYIQPSLEDRVVLSPALSYQKLISWNEPINPTEYFGINCDYIAFTPLDKKSDEGILWVNNEFPTPYLIHKEALGSQKTKEQVIAEQKAVGGSLIHIKHANNQWSVVKNSKYNRRISGETEIPFVNAEILGKKSAIGTFANCAGGVTPWGTILTCEENYDDYYGEVEYTNGKRIKNNKARY